MPVIFENPGIIDVKAAITMGVNVKESEGAFGYFGTGFKYALAVILRENCEVEIRTAESSFKFAPNKELIRGMPFNVVYMNGQPLGFTTELGRNWKLWMAYRELFCNAIDEGGQAYEANSPVPEANKTYVIVHGPNFAEVHRQRGSFILESKPWLSYPGYLDVHQQQSQGVFYRGILVHTERENLLYTYDLNPVGQLRLTEDRTLAGRWKFVESLCEATRVSDSREFIYNVLTAPMGFLEYGLDFQSLFGGTERPSETFVNVVLENQHRQGGFNRSAVKLVHNILGYEDHHGDVVEWTPREIKMLDRASRAIETLGYQPGKYNIELVESLGEGTMGKAIRKSGKIVLSRTAFDQGTKYVASTLFEEFVHLYHGHDDCTRGMQTFLFDRLLTLVEELNGEPI